MPDAQGQTPEDPQDPKTPPEPTEPGQTPTDPPAPGPTPEADPEPGQTPDTPPNEDEDVAVDDLPEPAQRLIRNLRQEAARYRTRLRALEARSAERDQQLEQEQRYQELAQRRQERIAELEGAAERADRLAQRLAGSARQEIQTWPPELQEAAPAEDEDVEALIDYVDRFRPVARKLLDAPAAPGTSPRPAVNGRTGETAEARERQRAWQREAERKYR